MKNLIIILWVFMAAAVLSTGISHTAVLSDDEIINEHRDKDAKGEELPGKYFVQLHKTLVPVVSIFIPFPNTQFFKLNVPATVRINPENLEAMVPPNYLAILFQRIISPNAP
ncbi:MAG: hypothetical protein ACFCUU_06425 [Cyclobacteriaceae bacterium]